MSERLGNLRMNEKDQRLYKLINQGNGPIVMLEGERVISRIMNVPILSYSIICDYMGTKDPNMINSSAIKKLNDIFFSAHLTGKSMNGYSVCGLTVRECISE